MEKIALTYKLKPGKKEVYLKAHNNIWPEMLESLKKSGVYRMEIFLRNNRLFLFAEVESRERFNKVASTDPVYIKWNRQWEGVLESPFDKEESGPFAEMEQVFHFSSK
jgi:L-rhamnose mutarotase